MSGGRAPLTALEWLRVTHADTLSGRRIEEAIAAERERVLAPIRALAEEWDAEADEDDQWLRGPRVSVSEAQALPATIQQARDHIAALRAVLPPQPTTTEDQR